MSFLSDSATVWRLDSDPIERFLTDGLVARYRRREPGDFDEMLEAAVASYETTFDRWFCVPFVRVLGPHGLRHFDMQGAGIGVDNRALWHRDLPRLVQETGAEVMVVATQGLLTPASAPIGGVLAHPAAPTGILSIDCLDATGRHEQAVCLVEVGKRAARRIVQWRRADINAELLDGADNEPASVLSQLAANQGR